MTFVQAKTSVNTLLKVENLVTKNGFTFTLKMRPFWFSILTYNNQLGFT